MTKKKIHFWNNLALKVSMESLSLSLTHTHTVDISIHMIDKNQSFTETIIFFIKLQAKWEWQSCSFDHNWLQNIIKMSEFRSRLYQVNRGTLLFLFYCSEQPTSSNISRVHDLNNFLQFFMVLFAWKYLKTCWGKCKLWKISTLLKLDFSLQK